MALTAAQILEQRMARDRRDGQAELNSQWDSINRQYGPISRDSKREAARQRALSDLDRRHQAKASALTKKYKDQMDSFSEIDAMAQQGMLAGSNPEELKMRQVMPAAVAKAAFPTSEDAEEAPDPLAEYGKFHTQRQRVRSSLREFETVGARPKGTFNVESGWHAPWAFDKNKRRDYIDPGGVGSRPMKRYVAGYETDEETGRERPVYKHREATPDEIREWAELTEEDRRLTKAMSGIQRSDPMASRIRLAAIKSSRMGNARTFADKTLGSTPREETALDVSSMSDEELMKLAGAR